MVIFLDFFSNIFLVTHFKSANEIILCKLNKTKKNLVVLDKVFPPSIILPEVFDGREPQEETRGHT